MRALDILKIRNIDCQGWELFEAIESAEEVPAPAGSSLDIPQPLLVQLSSSVTESESEIPPDPDLTLLWNSQNDVIYEQQERLDLIYEDLEAKRETLEGYQLDWGEVALQSLLDSGLGFVLKKFLLLKEGGITSPWLDFFIDTIANFIPNAIQYLIKLYRRARSAIGAIKAENEAILRLPKSWDNYNRRLEVLVHHEQAIENLLKEILDHQKPIDDVLKGDFDELVQAVKDLQYNGLEFIYKDGSKYTLSGSGQILSGSD
jgi:hypothetical protein